MNRVMLGERPCSAIDTRVLYPLVCEIDELRDGLFTHDSAITLSDAAEHAAWIAFELQDLADLEVGR